MLSILKRGTQISTFQNMQLSVFVFFVLVFFGFIFRSSHTHKRYLGARTSFSTKNGSVWCHQKLPEKRRTLFEKHMTFFKLIKTLAFPY